MNTSQSSDYELRSDHPRYMSDETAQKRSRKQVIGFATTLIYLACLIASPFVNRVWGEIMLWSFVGIAGVLMAALVCCCLWLAWTDDGD